MRLIVLAAGQGTRLRPLTDDRPKTLVPFMGRPILEWTLDAAAKNGIDDVAVIDGYRRDRLAGYAVRHVTNAAYESTSMVGTLMTAEPLFGEGFVMSYGDIAYRPEVLAALLASTAEIGVVVDLDWQAYWERRFGDPLRDAESLQLGPGGTIEEIGQKALRVEDVQAQYIGLVAFRGRGVAALRGAWAAARDDEANGRPVLGYRDSLRRLAMTDVLDWLAHRADPAVTAVPVHGGWVEIDSPEDLQAGAERWTAGKAGATPW